jgi:MFS family permease
MNKDFTLKFPFFYGWVIVAISLIAMLIAYGIWWSFPVFYVHILNEFGWSRASTASIFTLGSVVYGFGSLLAGILVDRFGPRRLLPIAGLLIALGCWINSLAVEKWHFYAAYGIFMGLGVICTGFVPMTATISNWFTRKRGTALGIGLVGNVSPPLLAFPIQYLIASLGWRTSFMVLGATALFLIAPLTAIFMRSRPQDMGLRPDGLLAENESFLYNDKSALIAEKKTEIEKDWSLKESMQNFRFWLIFGVIYTLGMGAGIIMHHLVALAVDLGHSESLAAFVFSLAGIMAAMGRLGGFLADRLGREVTLTIVTWLFVLSATSLLILINTPQVWPLYIFAITFGLGGGLSSPAIGAGSADIFGGKSFGAILGFINIGYGIGQGMGAWAGGAIFDRTGSYQWAVITAFPLFILMSIFFWVAAPRKFRRELAKGN